MPRDPQKASRAGRIGALSMHSRYDSRQTTAAGRAAFLASFESDVDPDGVLDAEERGRRAQSLRRAYFTSLAIRSARARQARRPIAPDTGQPHRGRGADDTVSSRQGRADGGV